MRGTPTCVAQPALLDQVLHGRRLVHHLRRRGGVPVPVGRRVQGPRLVRPRGDDVRSWPCSPSVSRTSGCAAGSSGSELREARDARADRSAVRALPAEARRAAARDLSRAGREGLGRPRGREASSRRCSRSQPVEVHEVLSFYNMFYTEPQGRHHVYVCTNVPCSLRGARSLLRGLEAYLGVHSGETTKDGRITIGPRGVPGLVRHRAGAARSTACTTRTSTSRTRGASSTGWSRAWRASRTSRTTSPSTTATTRTERSRATRRAAASRGSRRRSRSRPRKSPSS